VTALVLVLAAAGSAGAYLFSLTQIYDSQTTKIDNAFPAEADRVPAAAAPASGEKPLNILVMGSDSRAAMPGEAAAGKATDQRADTIMIVHIPADRANVYGVSFMRDLWVNIPGHGEAKINAALALGGVPLMVQTVESLLQQRIHHVVTIDFAGFRGLTDALGGVDVDVKVPFTSSEDGRTVFTAGNNTLNGTQALKFVRERYAFADGDYQRVRNQQSFLRAIIAKTINADTLSNPVSIHNAVSAVSPFIGVDPGLNSGVLGGLGFSLRDVRQGNAVFFTVPTAGLGTSADGQSIVRPNTKAITDIGAALGEDKLGRYIQNNHFENGN
jgi:LCP family protein required for cell wall assembly